jgi:hypothetical protein
MVKKKKINSSLKSLILRKKRRYPHLGVHRLTELIFREHNIKVSKSSVSAVLVAEGVKGKKGRKQALSFYSARGVEPCGLMLLKALDHHVGLFDHLCSELKVYFSKIAEDTLRRLIVMASLSPLIGRKLKENVSCRGFLRLAGFYHLPVRLLDQFEQRINQYKPTVSLTGLKEDLRPVATIRFHFNNGHKGFCDAKMSTFWGSSCKFDYFNLPQRVARLKLTRMLREQMLIIGYTKSFDYLSPLVFDFISAAESGLAKAEFLDEEGRTLSELKTSKPRLWVFFGYSPHILSKGAVFKAKTSRLRHFSWQELGEFFSVTIPTRFIQPNSNREITLQNLLVTKGRLLRPRWGILTNHPLKDKRKDPAALLKKYFYVWPYIEEDFSRDMEIIGKSLFAEKKYENYLARMLPQRLQFSQLLDFARAGQILSIIFKEVVWGWEPKGKKGDFREYKDCLQVFLKQAPRELKKQFNQLGFYVGKKRVFIG